MHEDGIVVDESQTKSTMLCDVVYHIDAQVSATNDQ